MRNEFGDWDGDMDDSVKLVMKLMQTKYNSLRDKGYRTDFGTVLAAVAVPLNVEFEDLNTWAHSGGRDAVLYDHLKQLESDYKYAMVRRAQEQLDRVLADPDWFEDYDWS